MFFSSCSSYSLVRGAFCHLEVWNVYAIRATFFFFADPALSAVRAGLKHIFPFQDDLFSKVALFSIDTLHLVAFQSYSAEVVMAGSRWDPDSISAPQILEAKVVMKFLLSGDLSSSYGEWKVNWAVLRPILCFLCKEVEVMVSSPQNPANRLESLQQGNFTRGRIPEGQDWPANREEMSPPTAAWHGLPSHRGCWLLRLLQFSSPVPRSFCGLNQCASGNKCPYYS